MSNGCALMLVHRLMDVSQRKRNIVQSICTKDKTVPACRLRKLRSGNPLKKFPELGGPFPQSNYLVKAFGTSSYGTVIQSKNDADPRPHSNNG